MAGTARRQEPCGRARLLRLGVFEMDPEAHELKLPGNEISWWSILPAPVHAQGEIDRPPIALLHDAEQW